MRILLSGATEHQNYLQALGALGAEVRGGYLPPIDVEYDGLILCGGGDIAPARYGEEPRGSRQIDPRRDEVEMALLAAYVGAGKPILGICRGHQLINVFFGGSMHQHIPESPIHTNGTDHYCTHSVTAESDSIVGRLYGSEFPVNSAHHQAIKTLGAGLRATAFWQEQYIEAFEHTSLPVFGVQWHPEKMCFALRREDTVDGAPIFEHFLQLCKK